jgi:SAM-dependent methyltransferase
VVELRADPSWRLPANVGSVPPTHVSAGTHPPSAISPYHLEFANLELAKSLDYYERRVDAIGFKGLGRVLDAACGVGQWSLALALHNDEVHGIDRAEERLALAELIARRHDRGNVHLTHGDVEKLPFADGWFDAIVCYGVLMFLAPDIVLAEFRRVLRPGGRLYVSANGLGWSLQLMIRRRLWAVGWNTIQRTRYGMPRDTFLTRKRMESLLGEHGFRLDAWGGEGRVRAPGRKHVRFERAYPSRFLGFQAVWELLATRLDSDGPEDEQVPGVDLDESLGRTQDFDSPQRLVPAAVTEVVLPEVEVPPEEVPHYALDPLPEVTDEESDARLAALTRRTVGGTTSCSEAVDALIRFAQDAIYHNPVRQPPLTLHPYKVLRLGEGRCGHVVGLLVALFRAAGFSARSRQLRNHVIAEVFFDGEWRIADADAFKNGIIPRGRDGLLLTMRELEVSPYSIDRYQPSGLWMQPDTRYVRNAAGIPVTGYVDALPPERRGFLSNYYAFWLEPRYPPSIPALRQVDSPVSPGPVRLSWSPSSDPDGDLRGYRARVGTTSRGWSYDGAVYERLTAETGTELTLVETTETWIDVVIERPGTYVWSVSAFDDHRELEPETFYWSSDESSFEVR